MERDLPQEGGRKETAGAGGTQSKQKGISTNPTQKYMLRHTITELNAKSEGQRKEKTEGLGLWLRR